MTSLDDAADGSNKRITRDEDVISSKKNRQAAGSEPSVKETSELNYSSTGTCKLANIHIRCVLNYQLT